MISAVKVEILAENLIIRFNRPQMRNPLSVEVLESLHEILDRTGESGQFKKIIFTGTGDSFASGADLREIAGVTGETAREFALRGQRLMNKIAARNTVAAINGFCFGGGLDLALACRKRIAAPNALFSHPGANLGIMTGWGGTQRLPRLVGQAKALEIFLTAKRVTAVEAFEIGLIDEISQNPLAKCLDNTAQ